MKTALAVVVLVLSLVQPAFAQQDEAGARRAIAAVQEAIKQRPDDPTLYFFLARLEAEAGDAGATVAALAKVAELGDGFLPARELGFAKVWDDAKFQEVRARLESRLPRLDYAPIAFELEDSGLVPEGFAYDAASHDFFMGSIAKGKIVRIVDRVAYINHDIDDAVRAGVISVNDLPSSPIAILGESGQRRIDALIHDLVEHSAQEGDVVQGARIGGAMAELRSFMFKCVYLGPAATREHSKIELVVRTLFDHFCAHPELIPDSIPPGDLARRVTDHLAGMTDRYCIHAFEALTVPVAFAP